MEHSTPIKTGIYSFYLHTLLQRKRVFLNIGISLTLFILNNLRTNDMYPGARCISTAIEPHKKWIEDWSKRLQDILQKITDKMVDLAETLGKKKEDEIKAL